MRWSGTAGSCHPCIDGDVVVGAAEPQVGAELELATHRQLLDAEAQRVDTVLVARRPVGCGEDLAAGLIVVDVLGLCEPV